MGIIDIGENVLAQQKAIRKIILKTYDASMLQTFFLKRAVASSERLRDEASKCREITEYVNLSFNYTDVLFSLMPTQIPEEITALLRILNSRPPKHILEIGTARGGSLFLFTRIASPDAIIVSLDLPQGEGGGGYYPDWKMPFYRSFATSRQKIKLLRVDSHLASTYQVVEKTFGRNKLDFLFLDGDHSYNGVKKDFDMYHSLVKEGGVIGFHDICMEHVKDHCEPYGVNKFWNEVKQLHPYQEIISDPKQNGFGIGLLYL